MKRHNHTNRTACNRERKRVQKSKENLQEHFDNIKFDLKDVLITYLEL